MNTCHAASSSEPSPAGGAAQATAETIVALATAAAPGAVAVVRLSGPQARQMCGLLAPDLPPAASHRLARRTLRGPGGEPLDDALVVHFHAPRSYTGEDVAELHLHGGLAVVDAVLRRCVQLGARQARAGEFTERAFLAGRIDLAQAEAVAALIAAEDEGERRAALQQLEGGLSRRIGALVSRLSGHAASLRAELDFPLDVPTLPPARPPDCAAPLALALREVAAAVAGMLAQARISSCARSPKVAICGPPNAGKSTLLNAWLHQDRVLVDPQPGTTRDPVAADLQRAGLRLQVVDTAGIRPAAAAEGIEQRGMAMSARTAAHADLVLWLLPLDGDPRDAGMWPPEGWPEGIKVVGSKADLAPSDACHRQAACAAARGLPHWGFISARDALGSEQLAAAAVAALQAGHQAPLATHLWPVSQRQRDHLERAAEELAAAGHLERGQGADDLLLSRLEEAMRQLGAITGQDVQRDLTDQIFASFCIGK